MAAKSQAENPFLNLIVNILIPVIVLNKGHQYLSPMAVLGLALAFPVVYGIHDYVKNRHKNYVSLLGVVNTLLTGGLAALSLQGIWFAVKEASLPLLLGLMVLGSAWTKNPAARMMFCNPQVLNLELIDARLIQFGRQPLFEGLLRRTTIWLSFSFFVSSLLNFVLAVWIFQDIDPALETAARDQMLNEQIAKMTWMGFAVIAAPLMIFSAILVYRFLQRLSKMTEEPISLLLKS